MKNERKTSYQKGLRIPRSDLKDVSVRLKEEREKIEPEQKIFGFTNSISINFISLCENAHKEPSAGYLYKLGQMGVSIDYILYGESRGKSMEKVEEPRKVEVRKETLEEFYRIFGTDVLAEFSYKERLDGIPLRERLEGFSKDEILAALVKKKNYETYFEEKGKLKSNTS